MDHARARPCSPHERPEDGWTAIADRLTAEQTPTVHGGLRWYPAIVRALVLAAAPQLARVRRRRRP
ncbi:MAG: hypothetical protein ABI473_03850 [Candidatus Dormibacter sp.]